MGWMEFAPTLIVAVLVLVLPGVPVVAILRLGPVASILLAPVAGLTALALATLLAHVLPLDWSVAYLAVAAAAVAGVALLVRRGSASPPMSTRVVLPAAAVVAAGVVIALRIISIIGDPAAISQTYDNVFHLNAVAYILASGDASPLRISTLSYDVDGRGGFYPALWHAGVALIAQIAGTGIPAATTAMAIVTCALVWPASVILLARALLGSSRIVTVTAGALSAGLYAMPYLLVDWGVLYPTLLSFAVVPAALSAIVWLARPRVGEAPSRVTASVILLGAVAVIALAHPSGLGAVILFALPVTLPAIARGVASLWRSGDRRRARLAAAASLATLAAGAGLMVVLRPSIFASDWPPTAGAVDAVRFAVTMGGMVRPFDLAATLLIGAGFATVLGLRRNRSFIALWLIPVALQSAALSLPIGPLRFATTGTWYTDDNRIASLVVIGAIPLMIEGVRGLIVVGSRVLGALGARPGRELALVAALIAAATVIAGTQGGPPLRVQMQYAEGRYGQSDDSEVLSVDERALLERVAESVPEEALVIGNPWTGASLVFAFSGRRTLVGSIGEQASQRAIDALEVLAVGTDEECAVAGSLSDEIYALDFGTDGAQGKDQPDPELEESERWDLEDSEGEAALYRFRGC